MRCTSTIPQRTGRDLLGFAVTLTVILCLVSGCGDGDSQCGPREMPGDFTVLYEHFGAPAAPPYPYAYTVYVNLATEGQIEFSPDCYTPDHPTWHMVFAVCGEDLEALYESMLENNVFRSSWDRIDPPEGASSQCMTVTATADTFFVPTWVSDDQAVAGVYSDIYSLVPGAVWDTLMAWRDRYIKDYPVGLPERR